MTWFTNRFLPLSISSGSDIPIHMKNSDPLLADFEPIKIQSFLALIIGWSLLWNYWIWSSFCIWSLMICSLLRAVWWWFGDENSSFMLQPTYLIFKSAAAPQLLVVVGSVLTFSGSSLSNSLGYALSRRNLHSNTKIHIASEPTYYSSKARGKIDKSKRKNTKYFAAENWEFHWFHFELLFSRSLFIFVYMQMEWPEEICAALENALFLWNWVRNVTWNDDALGSRLKLILYREDMMENVAGHHHP